MWRMQASWQFRVVKSGVVIESVLFPEKYLIERIESNKVFAILQKFQTGIKKEELADVASAISLNFDDIVHLFSYLIIKKILIRSEVCPSNFKVAADKLFDRQVRFLNTYETESNSGQHYQNKIRSAKVAIIGIGGFGCWLSLILSSMGIGTIIGIDFDLVELSNLDRQILFTTEDIGHKKVFAAKKRIEMASGGTTKFIPHDQMIRKTSDLEPIIIDCDLVLNPFSFYPMDQAFKSTSGIVYESCFNLNIPMLSLGGNLVGPISIPGKTICYYCACKSLEKNDGIDFSARNPMIQKRMFAPTISTVCSMAAWEAIAYLTDFSKVRVNDRLLRIDWSEKYDQAKVLELKNIDTCRFCGSISV